LAQGHIFLQYLHYDKLEKCNYFIETVISLIDKNNDDRTLSYILTRGIAKLYFLAMRSLKILQPAKIQHLPLANWFATGSVSY